MASSSPSCVFVYGTLMAEEVVRTLLGRMPAHCPAVIKDYRRYAIASRQYPAIIPVKGSKVQGKVLFDLSGEELQIFDLFEDNEYTREVVIAFPLEQTTTSALVPASASASTSASTSDSTSASASASASASVSASAVSADPISEPASVLDPAPELASASKSDSVSASALAGSLAASPRLPCEAGVYVWSDRLAKELEGDWSYEDWRKAHLTEYVEMCQGFPEEGEGLELRLQLESDKASKADLD